MSEPQGLSTPWPFWLKAQSIALHHSHGSGAAGCCCWLLIAADLATVTMVSMQEVTNMIEVAVKGALAHASKKDFNAGHLDERHFRRIDKFSGDPIKWREWVFQFKTAVEAVNNKTRELLEEIHKVPKDPDWEEIFQETTSCTT